MQKPCMRETERQHRARTNPGDDPGTACTTIYQPKVEPNNLNFLMIKCEECNNKWREQKDKEWEAFWEGIKDQNPDEKERRDLKKDLDRDREDWFRITIRNDTPFENVDLFYEVYEWAYGESLMREAEGRLRLPETHNKRWQDRPSISGQSGE